MKVPAQHLDAYRAALAAGAFSAPETEKRLFALHAHALFDLSEALSMERPVQDILALLGRERRTFGWSFLSGPLGGEVERAFNALANELEQQCA
jgi:hypothetical protein